MHRSLIPSFQRHPAFYRFAAGRQTRQTVSRVSAVRSRQRAVVEKKSAAGNITSASGPIPTPHCGTTSTRRTRCTLASRSPPGHGPRAFRILHSPPSRAGSIALSIEEVSLLPGTPGARQPTGPSGDGVRTRRRTVREPARPFASPCPSPDPFPRPCPRAVRPPRRRRDGCFRPQGVTDTSRSRAAWPTWAPGEQLRLATRSTTASRT
jgi:hypothetical protein